jgi:hypothetical protein
MASNPSSPKVKYDELCSLLSEETEKYNNLPEKNQSMKSGLTKAAKIAGIESQILKLEPFKFDNPLSPGAKTFLKRLYGEIKYKKQSYNKEIGTKYTTKGKMVEQQALEMISFLDGQDYKKNEVRLKNNYLSGIPDSFIGERVEDALYVPDVKSSWDLETFLENLGKPLLKTYWWQLQGYFDLTGALGGEVSYCLLNTPQSIIDNERYLLMKRMDVVSDENIEYKKAERILINNLTFDDIPIKERRLKFEVNRDDAAIEKIHTVVYKCRTYLEEIQEMHLSGFFSDKEIPFLETIQEI